MAPRLDAGLRTDVCAKMPVGMAVRAFYDPSAEREVAEAIRRVEGTSSAEIMAAIRPSSGRYLDVDCMVGFVAAFAGVLVFLFHPAPIRIEAFALEFPLLYGLGMALSAWIPPLRRLLVSRRRLEGNVATAARAAFVELGVGSTRGRSGMLVFVSMFERKVVVVPDVGIDRKSLAAPIAKLEAALSGSPEIGTLVAALDGLAVPLASVLPRAADDANQLPDKAPTGAGTRSISGCSPARRECARSPRTRLACSPARAAALRSKRCAAANARTASRRSPAGNSIGRWSRSET